MGNDLVIMFAKAPVAGKVKTRLQPPLTPEEAADFHRCFLLDQAERILGGAQKKGMDAWVSAAGDRDHPVFAQIAEMGITVVPQSGDGLGDRMALAIEEGLAKGYRSVTLIGSDSPTLPLAILEDAIAALEEVDVAIGPSFDGGFTSISARVVVPGLRKNIPWSRANTLCETAKVLRNDQLVVRLVGFWYDVDNEQGVSFLLHHLLGALLPDAETIAPRTTQWLRSYGWVDTSNN